MNRMQQRVYTGGTLIVLAAVFLALVVLSGLLLRGVRLDLTQNRLYTLSEGTQRIVQRLEEPVNLYFFFSESAARDLPPIRTYATRVRELLEEVAARSGGKVRLEVIDPLPFSEAEDRATGYGLQAVPVGAAGDTLFFGLAGTNATDGQMVIPFFQPDKEAFLEYDIAKLIHALSSDRRPAVGLLSSLNMGPGFDPATGRVGEGWVIDGELRQMFDLRRLGRDVDRIADDIDALVLVHPKNLPEDTLYAIDQFVLRGGRLLVFVDPHSELDPGESGPEADPMFAARSSDLPRLFRAWGVQYDPNKAVLDARNALQVQPSADRPPVRHLGFLGLGRPNLNQQDVVSGDLDSINLAIAGHFNLADDAQVRLEPLIQSSPASMAVDVARLRFLPDPEALFDGFEPSGVSYVLAARLSGTLKTAFPERSGEGHLAESREPANIILVGDADMLADRLWVQVQNFFGQRIFNPFANNGDFVINAVDNLVGSNDLIAVRTRPTSSRPFTVVEDLRRRADDRFRAKERELQAELAETERRLVELQGDRADGAQLLSPEQQAEIQRFRQEQLRIRQELRQVRRQLDADIQSLGARLKFLNIVGMPLLVTLFALGFAWWKARRRREALAR